MAGAMYFVENTVRRVGTRLHRAKSATRHRFQQFIDGKRLLRGKRMPLTEERFRALETKLMQLVKDGAVAVYCPDGTKITSLHTGEFVYTTPGQKPRVESAKEAPVAPPKPEPVIEKEPEPEPQKADTVDDLTVLPNIGAGRAKKLDAAGITSFDQLVEYGVDGLVELFGLSEEVAQDIIDAAEERV